MNKNEVFFGWEPELEPEPGKQNCGAWRAKEDVNILVVG